MNVTIGKTGYTFTLTGLEDATIGGIPPANGGYVYVNGIRWRVIGMSDDKWLLIRDLGTNKQGYSQAIAYCKTLFDGFHPLEKNAVLSTSKKDIPYGRFLSENLSNANLFLFSVSEALTYFNSDTARSDSRGWWLRSLCADSTAGYVDYDGSILYAGKTNGFACRPALVLNRTSILFESPATSGKPAADNGFGAYTIPTTAVDRKLTLLDSARSGFTASAGSSSAIAGGTLTVNYSDAATGENEYVSAMLCDASGAALYYASLTPDSTGSGTWDLTIPADLPAGSYTLKVFSEQRNGNNQTDYASGFVSIPLTVTPAYTVTVNNGTGGGNYAEGESVTITASVPETGKQFAGWTGADGLTFTSGSAATATATFTMPASAVEVTAVYEDILALSFAPGETQALPMDAWMQLQYYETAEDEPPLIRYDEATGTEALDVNRDGKPDLQIAFDDAANCVNLARLPDCAAVGEFAFAFSGPTDRYSTIVFNLITAAAPTFGTPDLRLPAFLTTVEEEAFEGIAAGVVDVPERCTSIGNYAFRNCPNLTQIRIPENCALGVDVFDGCTQVYVYGTDGSDAEAYCSTHANCVFVAEK